MRQKHITITQKKWGGLDYVEVHGVPAKKDLEHGDLVHAQDIATMEHRIAEEILLQQRPICGLEVAYLRKVFGMSGREFAREMHLSNVAVVKWEKARQKRLIPTSEIAVRIYFAKKLKLSLNKVTSPLIPSGKHPSKLTIEFDPSNKAKAA